jgi:hypothetical protein
VGPEVVYPVIGVGLLLATVLPYMVRGRALSVPMVVLSFGIVAGVAPTLRDLDLAPKQDAEGAPRRGSSSTTSWHPACVTWCLATRSWC